MVLKKYTPMIYKIMAQLHIRQNTEDFFSEGICALYEAYLKYEKEKGDFSPYAYANIRGRLLNLIQKEERMMPKEKITALEFCPQNIQAISPNLDIRLFIQNVYASLSPTEQKLFTLVFLADLPLIRAISHPELQLSYRQGKYMLKKIRQIFQESWIEKTDDLP